MFDWWHVTHDEIIKFVNKLENEDVVYDLIYDGDTKQVILNIYDDLIL